jgi:CheY-like chemotaxis protein
MARIVVVEDNADNRLLVRAILESDHDVIEYDSGVTALRCIADDAPDLILLDISLPEMDGVQVLRGLREDSRLQSVPVIALTAHAMSSDRSRFLEAGFDEYVAKPITDDSELQEKIRRLVEPP